jgi:hypothetical protein
MINVYYTMQELKHAAEHNDENVPPPKASLTPEERSINNALICMLRHDRERRFNERNRDLSYGLYPLNLDPVLPLPNPQLGEGGAPWLLSMDHLQDYCNKSTSIYANGRSYHCLHLYKYIFEWWSPGSIHKLDINTSSFNASLQS